VAGEAVRAPFEAVTALAGLDPMSSRVSAAQVYSRGHHWTRSAKAENARSTGTGTITAWGIGASAGRRASGLLGRTFLDGPAVPVGVAEEHK